MSDKSEKYFATIFYVDAEGGQHTIMGLVVAVDYDDAMNAVIDAVALRPDCANILGGVLEPATDELLAALAATQSPHAPALPERAYRAPGTTVH